MGLILIADNSASERQRLRQIMESEDHVVVEADNSLYCLELIEVHRLDGALLNPFLSGTEQFELKLLQALQQRKIPAIALAEDNIDNLLTSHALDEHKTMLFAQAELAIEELQVTGDLILFFQVD